MSDESKEFTVRLSKAAKEFNVAVSTIQEFLTKKGFQVDSSPNTKLTKEMYDLVVKEYQGEKEVKNEAKKLGNLSYKGGSVSVESALQSSKEDEEEDFGDDVFIRTNTITSPKKTVKPVEEVPVAEPVEEKPVVEAPKPVEEKTAVQEPKEEPVKEEKVEEKQQPKPEAKEDNPEPKAEPASDSPFKVVGKIDLDSLNTKTHPDKKHKDQGKKKEDKQKQQQPQQQQPKQKQQPQPQKPQNQPQPKPQQPQKPQPKPEQKQEAKAEPKVIKIEVKKLEGPKILDKIELPVEPKRSKGGESGDGKKKKRKRIAGKLEGSSERPIDPKQQQGGNKPAKGPKPQGGNDGGNAPKKGQKDNPKDSPKPSKKDKKGFKKEEKVELSDEEISKQIKDTLARLSPMGKSKTSKHRREKRQQVAGNMMEELARQEEEKSILKVTEFVTANELATMMNVPVVKVIATCMSLGMPVSINQRLDAEALSVVASEFGFQVDFVSADVQEAIAETEEEDREEDMVPRAPVVTVMGHVDHGKTKLLDYIRNTNVVAGEAGGITQHIGAYKVRVGEKNITFLDTPGHEAFTSMRLRGALATDIAILVVAADDGVMPQTVEAINHAKAAKVPIIVAINKMDRPGANPDHVKQQLSEHELIPEDWGGDTIMVPCSAHTKEGISDLLEMILLVAEVQELKANPELPAHGTIVEAQLDKGRGPVATVLIQRGTLHIGDTIIAGMCYGKVRAMVNDRGEKVKKAGPSTPVEVLGLNDVPQAGDIIDSTDERIARSVAEKRIAKKKEDEIKLNSKVSLDDLFQRIKEGVIKELNIVVKADVQGTIEALKASLEKIKNEEVKVVVVHAGVGAITESDVMLASAANALIIGFNVRPDANARNAAEKEKIDIRTYRVIYDALNDVEAAIKGMLAPKFKEVVQGRVEIRQVITINKMLIAGCYVVEGKVTNHSKVRVIRDNIELHEDVIDSLRRFKDDVKEVAQGFECGITLEKFRDIKEGDIFEVYDMKEVAVE